MSEKKLFSIQKNSIEKLHHSGDKNNRDLVRNKKRLMLILSFFLPVFFGMIAFIVRGLAPFGRSSLCAIDAFGQYFPMIREAERHFFHPHVYSLNGALGFSFAAESAYYTSSPFLILLYLLPGPVTVWEVDMLMLIKYGLMGLSFCYYLQEKDRYISLLNCALAVSYALSGYTLAFINQFMWMDTLIFLPLCCTGLRRIFRGKSPWLYLFSLTFCIISCFYTAWMVCLYLTLYYLYFLLCTEKDSIGVRLKKTFLSFAIFSVLAGVLSLPVLLPLLKALKQTAAVSMGIGELKFYHPIWKILLQFLPYVPPSRAFGPANYYFGLFALIPLIFAAREKTIPFKKKAGVAILILFLVLSTDISWLEYIWHGFHYPNQLPGRQSFLFIFTVLSAAGAGVRYLPKTKYRMVVAFLLSAEILSCFVIGVINYCPTVSAAHVTALQDRIDANRERITPDYENGEFFRTEFLNYRDNGGQLYGFPGISFYSSTMSKDSYDFFVRLGVDIYAKRVSTRYKDPMELPILNDLFSIRYIMDKDGNLRENKNPFSLGFLVSDAVLDAELSFNGYEFQNELIKCMSHTEDLIVSTRGEVDNLAYLKAREKMLGFGNCTIESIKEKVFYTEVKGKVTVNRETEDYKDPEHLLLCFSLPSPDARIYVDGEEKEVLSVGGYMAAVRVEEGEHQFIVKLK